jgi:hypothetical protein
MKQFILLSLYSMLLNSCIKEECQIVHYEFEIPATLTPAKDSFNIGDTITIISNFSNEVYERQTDKWYRLENFKFYPGTYLYKIDSNNTIANIQDNFEVIIDTSYKFYIHKFSDGSEGIFGQYNYSDMKYSLMFKLILKKAGLYYMENGVRPYLSDNQDFEGKCKNVSIDGAVNLNDGADNNIHMLKDSPDPHYNDWILQKPDVRFYKFGGYCFYVKD